MMPALATTRRRYLILEAQVRICTSATVVQPKVSHRSQVTLGIGVLSGSMMYDSSDGASGLKMLLVLMKLHCLIDVSSPCLDPVVISYRIIRL